MYKIIAAIVLSVLGVAVYGWYSAQALPAWYSENETQETQVANQLGDDIKNQGVANFLGDKFADVMRGNVVFSETEFNVILLASLKADDYGRQLLEVSDGVRAILHDDKIEISAVINLDKVEKIDANARQAVEKVNRIFPFLSGSRVVMSLFGQPVARNGQIAFKDSFSAKVGVIPISNDSLRKLGVDVERANSKSLSIKYLSVNSVDLSQGEISLGVVPKF